MITNSTNHSEVYSLGMNERLAQNHIEKLKKSLEDRNEKTEEISQTVVKNENQEAGDTDSLIDSYIERSRKTIFERIKDKTAAEEANSQKKY